MKMDANFTCLLFYTIFLLIIPCLFLETLTFILILNGGIISSTKPHMQHVDFFFRIMEFRLIEEWFYLTFPALLFIFFKLFKNKKKNYTICHGFIPIDSILIRYTII